MKVNNVAAMPALMLASWQTFHVEHCFHNCALYVPANCPQLNPSTAF